MTSAASLPLPLIQVVLLLIASGCASSTRSGSSGPTPERDRAPEMQPFVTLKEETAISRERAIEIARAEVQRRKPGTPSEHVEAILVVSGEATVTVRGKDVGKLPRNPTWQVSDHPLMGGGWQVTVDANTGEVLFCHVFARP